MNYLVTRNRDIPSLFNDVLFKDFFGEDWFSPIPSLKKINYPVDIYETDEGIQIDIAAVGLDKSDIKIDISGDMLKVSHTSKEGSDDERCAYRGITKKSFNFAWRVSDKLNITKTEAGLDKGLLTIKIPTAPDKKPKEIEVKIK